MFVQDTRLFGQYHSRLKDALARLTKAIYSVIESESPQSARRGGANRGTTVPSFSPPFFTFIADQPVDNELCTPTSAHTNLKHLVDCLVQDVSGDPDFDVSEARLFRFF